VTGGRALCDGLGVTTAAGAAEVLAVIVGVGEVLVGVGEVLGVAVGEVLGVGVGELLGVGVGEVLGQVAVGTNPPVLWSVL
jgi:hypothetical protein